MRWRVTPRSSQSSSRPPSFTTALRWSSSFWDAWWLLSLMCTKMTGWFQMPHPSPLLTTLWQGLLIILQSMDASWESVGCMWTWRRLKSRTRGTPILVKSISHRLLMGALVICFCSFAHTMATVMVSTWFKGGRGGRILFLLCLSTSPPHPRKCFMILPASCRIILWTGSLSFSSGLGFGMICFMGWTTSVSLPSSLQGWMVWVEWTVRYVSSSILTWSPLSLLVLPCHRSILFFLLSLWFSNGTGPRLSLSTKLQGLPCLVWKRGLMFKCKFMHVRNGSDTFVLQKDAFVLCEPIKPYLYMFVL